MSEVVYQATVFLVPSSYRTSDARMDLLIYVPDSDLVPFVKSLPTSGFGEVKNGDEFEVTVRRKAKAE